MAALAVISALTGCKKETSTEDATKFTVEVSASSSSASISVKADGNGTYIVFCTEDLTSGPAELANEEIRRLGAEAQKQGCIFSYFLYSGNSTVTVTGLENDTDYRVIVMGTNEDTSTYGMPAVGYFHTRNDSYSENPDWNVSVSDVTANSAVITMTTNSSGLFFFDIYPLADFEAYGSDLALYIEEAIAYFGDENVTGSWEDCEYVYNSSAEEEWDLVPGTEYVCFAIGINPDGTPSGLYARGENFTTSGPGTNVTASTTLEYIQFRKGTDFSESSESFRFSGTHKATEMEGSAIPLDNGIKYWYFDIVEKSIFETEYESDIARLRDDYLHFAVTELLPYDGFAATFETESVVFNMEDLADGTEMLIFAFGVEKAGTSPDFRAARKAAAKPVSRLRLSVKGN